MLELGVRQHCSELKTLMVWRGSVKTVAQPRWPKLKLMGEVPEHLPNVAPIKRTPPSDRDGHAATG
jgi:hypothetical protein